MPDAAYLAAAALAGMDVLYVITGTRDYEPPPALSAAEQELLDLYRRAPTAVKHAALGALLGATGRSGHTMQIGRVTGQVSSGDVTNYFGAVKPAKKTPP